MADTGLADRERAWLGLIGERMAEARRQRGTSLERLAKMCRVAENVLAAIEANTAESVDLATAWRAADALWITVADLLGTPGASRLDHAKSAAANEHEHDDADDAAMTEEHGHADADR